MNDRIRQLAEQAGFEITPWGNESVPCVHQEGPIDVELEKFAELIVRELVQRLRFEGELATIQAFVGSIYKTAYMHEAANIVKQHFGVDE